ncbi:MAG: NAD(P)H-hydrate dehydratase [Actinomycetota bacterium]
MRPILTSAETQALDRAAEERGVPISLLMERAGLAVAHAAVDLVGGAYGRRVVVLCGKGNNGGDGLVAARYLDRWGMGVTVVLLAEPGEFRSPADENFRLIQSSQAGGIRWRPFERSVLVRDLDRADVAVDAVFGSGFRGVAEGAHAEAIEAVVGSGVPVVAVDVPSGVEGDTGLVRGPAVRADVTVTFGAPKLGTVFFPGAAHAGIVEVAGIGFPEDLVRSDLALVELEDVASMIPIREVGDHKRRSGVVLVVAGSRRMTGAPTLVAEGAYRAGAGLVRVAVPESILPIVQSHVAEATFVSLPEGPAGSVREAAWDVLAESLGDVDAVAIGPGLSTDDETPAFVARLVRESPVPVVVDADAINAFAGRAAELAERTADAVVTPHAGEFGRLFGMPSAEVLEDRVGFARKAAAETRAVFVLKGPRTLVALPDGEVRVNPTGSPTLATGGTGDVLTGVIAAYLARGLPAADAATAGCFVHGLAGDEGSEGMTAGDVARGIPEAVLEVLRHS